jgi:hypothetical protein
VAEEADAAAHRPPVGGQVAPEHEGRARRHRQQAGAQPQQTCLPGPVGPLQQDDLALIEVQVGPGENREPPEQGDS